MKIRYVGIYIQIGLREENTCMVENGDSINKRNQKYLIPNKLQTKNSGLLGHEYQIVRNLS